LKKITLTLREFDAVMVKYHDHNNQPLDYVFIQFNPISTFPVIDRGTIFRGQMLTLLLYIHNEIVLHGQITTFLGL
jgi:hypothetical protein